MITCKFLNISNSYDIIGIIMWNESYIFCDTTTKWFILGIDQSCNESQLPPPPPPAPSEIADNSILIHGLTLHNWLYLWWFKIEFFISDYFSAYLLFIQKLYISAYLPPQKFVQHYFSNISPMIHSRINVDIFFLRNKSYWLQPPISISFKRKHNPCNLKTYHYTD